VIWQQINKWYSDSDKKYRVCATRNNGVIIYDAWAPPKENNRHVWIENTTNPAKAKELCETHFNNQQQQK